MAAVNVWYHVGSKNEKPGRTGFAHLFEHMMFQGSANHDKDYFLPLQKIGAQVNGSTNKDRTNYWENVPSDQLKMALFMEADRMGFLVPAMTREKLDNQRDVVKNEKRQGENRPYAKNRKILLELMYPEGHPYRWTVIGSMDDLSAASVEDVSEFFKLYYAPNNENAMRVHTSRAQTVAVFGGNRSGSRSCTAVSTGDSQSMVTVSFSRLQL